MGGETIYNYLMNVFVLSSLLRAHKVEGLTLDPTFRRPQPSVVIGDGIPAVVVRPRLGFMFVCFSKTSLGRMKSRICANALLKQLGGKAAGLLYFLKQIRNFM